MADDFCPWVVVCERSVMASRGAQTYKKRQKEQQRKERQQEKFEKRMERKRQASLDRSETTGAETTPAPNEDAFQS
jgi:hypothetical protein